MAFRRRYFLIDEPCAAAEIPKMMCRVVKDKHLPLHDKYVPIEPIATAANPVPQSSHNTNDLIPGILPEPSSTTSRKDFIAAVKDHSLNLALTSLFGLNLECSKEERAELEAAEVKRYALKNPGEYFEILMKDEHYASEVRTLLKDASFGRAYLVTGFMTSVGATWTKGGEKRTVVGGELTAPITEALGVPSPLPGVTLDPSIALQHGRASSRETTMIAADEEIFAVAYAVLKRRYSAKAGLHRVEKVGPPLRGKAHHLLFSGEDDDEEEDEDSSLSAQIKMGEQANDIYLDETLETIEVTGTERSMLEIE